MHILLRYTQALITQMAQTASVQPAPLGGTSSWRAGSLLSLDRLSDNKAWP